MNKKIIFRISPPLFMGNQTQRTIYGFLKDNEDKLTEYEEYDNLVFLTDEIRICDYDLEENRVLTDKENSKIGCVGKIYYSINKENEIYIYEIFVLEKYRRMKIASRLVKRLLETECLSYSQIQWSLPSLDGQALKKHLDSNLSF